MTDPFPPPTLLHVLVVEDQPDLGVILARFLEHAGYVSAMVPTARQAQGWLAQHYGATRGPALVLIDVSLHPGDAYENGCRAAEAWLARWPDLRVVFMSGYGAMDREGVCPPGAPWLQKPFDRVGMLSAIRTAWGSPPWRFPEDWRAP